MDGAPRGHAKPTNVRFDDVYRLRMRALGGGAGGRAAMRIGKEGGRSHTADVRQVRPKHCGNAISILRLASDGGAGGDGGPWAAKKIKLS